MSSQTGTLEHRKAENLKLFIDANPCPELKKEE